LMDELYPYTSSCVGMPDETEYGTVACGTCFWCHEKKWGFEGD
jgi:7-cyano-7-deazaguanine synthase in queuosine biosynthesis